VTPTSVLDASALLAYLHDEAGAQAVEEALAGVAAIGSPNLGEALSKLADEGQDPGRVAARLEQRGLLGQALIVEPLATEDAVRIARLRPKTRQAGLSLGDRACLAIALRLKLPAVTADRSWLEVDVGVDVRSIR
jgi:PIN domain nuclease of toxin-antitoxin system